MQEKFPVLKKNARKILMWEIFPTLKRKFKLRSELFGRNTERSY